MNRKEFIKSTALGIGVLSLSPLHAHKKPDLPVFNSPKIVRSEEGQKLNVIGDNQTIKLTGKDTKGQYTLIEQYNDPGVGIPPHVHENEDEVFQVLSGEVEMSIGEKSVTLKSGDIIFCPRGIPHSWKVVGQEKARAMLSIFPAGLEKMFEELSQLPPGPPDLEKVGQICEKYNLRFV